LKREKAAILACRTGGGTKGQNVDYLWENVFWELGATIDIYHHLVP